MPVLKNDVFTITNAPPGTRTTPTFNIPADVFAVKIACSRDNWPTAPDKVADILVEYANNVGQPDDWRQIAQLTATGGAGGSLPEAYGYLKLPDVGNNQRRGRGIITNTQTCTTTLSITTYS